MPIFVNSSTFYIKVVKHLVYWYEVMCGCAFLHQKSPNPKVSLLFVSHFRATCGPVGGVSEWSRGWWDCPFGWAYLWFYISQVTTEYILKLRIISSRQRHWWLLLFRGESSIGSDFGLVASFSKKTRRKKWLTLNVADWSTHFYGCWLTEEWVSWGRGALVLFACCLLTNVCITVLHD